MYKRQLPASAATRSQNAAVFEAEEYAFYYPASDAKLLHGGHGNFTVSGLTGGAISSDDFFTTVIAPETGSGRLTIDSSGYPVAPSSWQGSSSSGRAAGSSTTVSYTHLDVYKRQPMHGTAESGLSAGGASSPSGRA